MISTLYSFYFSEGFVHLESIVGEAIIRLMANPDMNECEGVLEQNISVSMRQLPYPQYTVDIFLSIIVTILPLFVNLGYAGVFTKVCLIIAHVLLYHNYSADHGPTCTEWGRGFDISQHRYTMSCKSSTFKKGNIIGMAFMQRR